MPYKKCQNSSVYFKEIQNELKGAMSLFWLLILFHFSQAQSGQCVDFFKESRELISETLLFKESELDPVFQAFSQAYQIPIKRDQFNHEFTQKLSAFIKSSEYSSSYFDPQGRLDVLWMQSTFLRNLEVIALLRKHLKPDAPHQVSLFLYDIERELLINW